MTSGGNDRGSRPPVRVVKCPGCGREVPYEGNPYRPFCSRGCKGLDLVHWVSGEYRIPSKPEEESPRDGRDDEPSHS